MLRNARSHPNGAQCVIAAWVPDTLLGDRRCLPIPAPADIAAAKPTVSSREIAAPAPLRHQVAVSSKAGPGLHSSRMKHAPIVRRQFGLVPIIPKNTIKERIIDNNDKENTLASVPTDSSLQSNGVSVLKSSLKSRRQPLLSSSRNITNIMTSSSLSSLDMNVSESKPVYRSASIVEHMSRYDLKLSQPILSTDIAISAVQSDTLSTASSQCETKRSPQEDSDEETRAQNSIRDSPAGSVSSSTNTSGTCESIMTRSSQRIKRSQADELIEKPKGNPKKRVKC